MTENNKVAALIADIEKHTKGDAWRDCKNIGEFFSQINNTLDKHRPIKPAEECTQEEALEIVRARSIPVYDAMQERYMNTIELDGAGVMNLLCQRETYKVNMVVGGHYFPDEETAKKMQPYQAKAYGIEI